MNIYNSEIQFLLGIKSNSIFHCTFYDID